MGGESKSGSSLKSLSQTYTEHEAELFANDALTGTRRESSTRSTNSGSSRNESELLLQSDAMALPSTLRETGGGTFNGWSCSGRVEPTRGGARDLFVNRSTTDFPCDPAGWADGLLDGKSCFLRAAWLTGFRAGGRSAAAALLASTALPNIGRESRPGLNRTAACTLACLARKATVLLARGRRTARRRAKLQIPVMQSGSRQRRGRGRAV
jgi:hypothetical protein